MRLLLIVAAVVVLGVLVFRRSARPPEPPPSPPPMPPAISVAPQPVLNRDQVGRVLESANDADPTVRWEAAKLLAQLNAPETDEILVRMIRRDVEANVRRNALDLLVERNGAKAVPLVVEALHDENADIRLSALQTINKLGDYSIAGVVSESLKDPDQRIRLAALKILNDLQRRKDDETRQEQARQEQIRQETLRKQAEEAAKQQNK